MNVKLIALKHIPLYSDHNWFFSPVFRREVGVSERESGFLTWGQLELSQTHRCTDICP